MSGEDNHVGGYTPLDQALQLGEDIIGQSGNDNYGTSVSLSNDGTILAIGAIGYDTRSGSNIGVVRIYRWNGTTWNYGSGSFGEQIIGEASDDESGSRISLSGDGTILAVSAINNDGNGDQSGHVRVYQYANDTWSQKGGDIDGEAGGNFAGDMSGWSVSLSGDGTVFASRMQVPNGVRVFQYSTPGVTGGTWTQLGSDIVHEAPWDVERFGERLSLSSDGTILAISVVKTIDVEGGDHGFVDIYQWNGIDTWIQLGQRIQGQGYSVSLSNDGTIVAIGSMGYDGDVGLSEKNDDNGRVAIYQWNGTDSWLQIQRFVGEQGDAIGRSVSLSSDGTIVAFGAPGSIAISNQYGYVEVYKIAEISGGGDSGDGGSGEPPPDTTNPVITLNGSNPTNLYIGDTYTELATASDNNDGDITSDIVITGSVDTSVSGSYTLTYNVKDAADNSATEVTRTVIVNVPGALISALTVPTTFTIKDDYIYIFNGLTKRIVRYDMNGNLDNANLVQLTKNATDMIFDSQNNLIVSEENGDILKIANVWKQGTPSDNSNSK